MDTRTIALDHEAYALLRAHKKKDESFSAVVKRHFRPRRHLLDFAGAWGKLPARDWSELEKHRIEARDADLRRQERLRIQSG